jgi:hypothetical protein
MPISKDLFTAILAMDSYNRDYNAGISIAGTQIELRNYGITVNYGDTLPIPELR